MPFPLAAIPAIVQIGTSLIDKLFQTDEEKAAAKVKLIDAANAGKLQELQTQLSAILAEAQSTDPWTSRARPTFLYVVYILLLAAVPFGMFWAYQPDTAGKVVTGFKLWLDAIPEPLYALFGAGYLGYTAFRSWDKRGPKS